MPRRTIIAVLAVLITVALGGCAAPQRPCPEGVLAAHYKLMSRAELIRYQDRLEDEMVRVGAGCAAPDGVSREDYLGDLRQRMKEIFEEIALNHGFVIEALEVSADHVHVFLSFPPRYSISRVVGMLRSISASVLFREHPEVKKHLWGGEFREDGYFVRTVGDKVTADIIRKHIEHHRRHQASPEQLELF